MGTSNAEGIIELSLRGREGEMVSFSVRCPEGHQAPATGLAVVLRSIRDSDRKPEYAVSCVPTTRTLVIAVRAENGPNLPVRYLGREVARTDVSGAAHVLLKVAPEDAIELTLDTSGSPFLRPKSPMSRFQATRQDDIFVLNQSFNRLQPKRTVRSGPKKPISF